MNKRFQDKVVFITGASSGIGAATARRFAEEGARVTLVARRAEKLAAVEKEIAEAGGSAMTCVADVSDRETLDRTVAQTLEAWGRIDIILANAGTAITGTVDKLAIEDYKRQFETNLFGVINTVQAGLEALKASRGQLGIVGSVAGVAATPATSAYNASKFAVHGLAKSLSFDLRRFGISVTLIVPGFVESEIRLLDRQGQLSGKEDPIPHWLVLPAPAAAKDIADAIYRKKHETIITFHGKLFVLINRFFPTLLRFLLGKSKRGRN